MVFTNTFIIYGQPNKKKRNQVLLSRASGDILLCIGIHEGGVYAGISIVAVDEDNKDAGLHHSSPTTYRPYTIWTLYDYDFAQTIDSQAQLWISAFPVGCKSGNDGKLKVDDVAKLSRRMKHGAIKDIASNMIKSQNLQSHQVVSMLLL
ncbi:unnamed protein product [Absidia cylindrospora]